MRFPVFSMIFGASLLLTTVLSAEEATRKIVVFKNGVSEATKITALENFGAKVVKIKDIPFINAVVVNMAQDSEMSLSANTAVEFVETDYYENWLEAVGEDDLREFQTTIQEPQVLPWGVNRIDAEKAWRKTAGRQIRIAVVDTGCGPHPDLRIWGGASVVSYTESYSDDHYHGTHVAGIIAAIDNEFGVVGVAPRVRLYAVKVLRTSVVRKK
ncbi:MAG: Aerolysin [Candidatus Jorgensenbacteria bacterium GW2011_GWF2_41_8]|uniref:Aerolysin n=1 Tax=Candidatus Jorgensenbacteria bacterium GW2011_GWF2_41_8 TaxID=1618667 RepID=A0A0G0ZT70_9BACT|nr:MAG: Aerolysin [Candidatus Jorgensenbacteria bacterium GW2011_GWF2_41_8]